MEMSFLIARLLGPILIVAAIPMIGSPRGMEALVRSFLQSPALIYVTGIGVLAAGLAIVNAHNRWAADWTVLITLFGWALVIGGAFRVVAPGLVVRIGQRMENFSALTRPAGLIWAAIGAVLSAKGYL
jgi:hypothetical protein